MPRFVAVAYACALISAAAANAAPPSAADEPEKPAGPGDKVVCKTFTKIGTLAGRYRTCKTKAEWEQERVNVRTVNWTNPCASAQTGSCDGK
ncbi:MAG TPA: hypothetical protein VD846_12585 [Allosphingosinicella sp.]|nr:hypothetical protein [Allosphingosinicella sp.]